MRWIVRSERPIALAMARSIQWVTAPGGSRRVRSTTACTLACGTGGGAGGGGVAGGAGLVPQQALNASRGKALLPAPHRRPADADPLGNLQHRQALGGQQDDLRPLNVLHRTPSVLDDPLQVRAMLSREEKRDSPSHSSRLAQLCASVNPPFASLH